MKKNKKISWRVLILVLVDNAWTLFLNFYVMDDIVLILVLVDNVWIVDYTADLGPTLTS